VVGGRISRASIVDLVAAWSGRGGPPQFVEADGKMNYIYSPTYQKNTMWKAHNSLVSYFGRFNYNLLDRYLLTATFRADGSSRFKKGKKWGYFPAAAFAWKINNEPFLKDAKWLDELKLRLGWGMTRPMTLLLPKEYIKDATKLIKKATTRVAFICMILTDDESTDDLIDALAAAARRGVAVHVAGDMFTYTEMSGQFIPSHYYSKRVRSTTRMAKELHAAGVDFHWLGRLNISTVSGRTHSKWCVVDDTVFSFGGVNLYEEALGNIDYMFKVAEATGKEVKIYFCDYHSDSYELNDHISEKFAQYFLSLGCKDGDDITELVKQKING
jgi:hypothetical protein